MLDSFLLANLLVKSACQTITEFFRKGALNFSAAKSSGKCPASPSPIFPAIDAVRARLDCCFANAQLLFF